MGDTFRHVQQKLMASLLVSRDEHRHVRMMEDEVAHGAKECSADLSQTSGAGDD